MDSGRLARRVQGAAPSATLAMKAEADRLRAGGAVLYDLGLGEPDFDTPPHIKEAGQRAIRENRTHYTAVPGIVELRKAIAARYATTYGAKYGPDEVLTGCGAKGVLFALSQALIDPGDEVAIFAPYWVSYPEQIRLAGGVPVIVPTSEDEGFTPRAAALEARLTPRTRVIVLNSPCNPTGAMIPAAEWQGIADLALAHDIVVISDECYELFVYAGETFVSGASCLPRLKDRLVLVGAVSKSYAMTGWRVGYALGPRDIIGAAAMVQSHDASQAPSISQHAALAAITGDQAPVAVMLAEYAKRREVVLEEMRRIPDVRCATPKGAFYAFPNVTGLYGRLGVGGSEELAAMVLREAQVVTVPGDGFGAPGYIRISYAAPIETVREGIRRIARLAGGAV